MNAAETDSHTGVGRTGLGTEADDGRDRQSGTEASLEMSNQIQVLDDGIGFLVIAPGAEPAPTPTAPSAPQTPLAGV